MEAVYVQPRDKEEQLRQLGLTEQVLLDAVRKGIFAFLNCTQNHPRSFAGMAAWGETVCGIREGLLPLGVWERFDDRNLPLTVNVETRIAITASSGDENTGIAELSPKSRNPKGIVTREIVQANYEQLNLFPVIQIESPTLKVSDLTTWLLLSYRDLNTRVVRCELSRPVSVGQDLRVDDWDERIILSSIPIDGDEIYLTGPDNSGGDVSGSAEDGSRADAITVEVKRRA